MKNDIYNNGYIINYVEGDRSLERTKIKHIEDIDDTTHTVIGGETLPSIAYKYYGTSRLWYLIADVNTHIINPFLLIPGEELLIPNKLRYER